MIPKAPNNISEMREFYFDIDRMRMVRLLLLGAMLPFVLTIQGALSSLNPLFVIIYSLTLSILIASSAFIAHRTRDYIDLDRFSRLMFAVFVPAFLYLRYTGIIDDSRNDPVALDFLLDMVIVFVSYAAPSIGPRQKLAGTTVYIAGVVTIYGTHIETIPGGGEELTTIALAYIVISMLGFGNAAMINNSRRVAFRSLRQEISLNAELSTALSTVKALSGLLPICANCKKIRDDQGYYQQIEHYITEHSDAEFTHGICPDCATLLYPELDTPAGETTGSA